MDGGTTNAPDAKPRIVILGLTWHRLRATPLRRLGSRGFESRTEQRLRD
jgi:hypothetical protein